MGRPTAGPEALSAKFCGWLGYCGTCFFAVLTKRVRRPNRAAVLWPYPPGDILKSTPHGGTFLGRKRPSQTSFPSAQQGQARGGGVAESLCSLDVVVIDVGIAVWSSFRARAWRWRQAAPLSP